MYVIIKKKFKKTGGILDAIYTDSKYRAGYDTGARHHQRLREIAVIQKAEDKCGYHPAVK
jgi:hypothetical protein